MHTPGPQDAGISNEARIQGMNPQPTMMTTETIERGLKQVGTHSVHSTMETTTTRSFDKRTQQFRYYERTYVFATGRVTMKEVTPPSQEPTPVPEPVPEPVPQAPESVTSETHSENETVISDIYSTASCPSELRKLCYACSQDVRTYRLVVTGLANGRNLIRNAHEGPCLHCATIKDMVDDKIAARTPRGKKLPPAPAPDPALNYPGPRPYPGFTLEELEAHLVSMYRKTDHRSKDEQEAYDQEKKDAYDISKRSGRTFGDIWINVPPTPTPTAAEIAASARARADAFRVSRGQLTLEEQKAKDDKDAAKARIKELPGVITRLYRERYHLYGFGTEEEYDDAKERQIAAEHEYAALVAQYGNE